MPFAWALSLFYISLDRLEPDFGIHTLLVTDQRGIADVDLKEVVYSGSPLKLAHGFNERSTLDVTNSASQLARH